MSRPARPIRAVAPVVLDGPYRRPLGLRMRRWLITLYGRLL